MFSQFTYTAHQLMRKYGKISAIETFTIIYLTEKISSGTYYPHISRCGPNPRLRGHLCSGPHMQTARSAERDTRREGRNLPIAIGLGHYRSAFYFRAMCVNLGHTTPASRLFDGSGSRQVNDCTDQLHQRGGVHAGA